MDRLSQLAYTLRAFFWQAQSRILSTACASDGVSCRSRFEIVADYLGWTVTAYLYEYEVDKECALRVQMTSWKWESRLNESVVQYIIAFIVHSGRFVERCG
ncbi:hypothetical protein FGIG_03873 [Fasciola gigantica]|uniref:Uncharacterized protein n=1 Tax=Fasciola gigantica TaxID=46835 RepID=A0A504ZA92_FASGI|nr:hypothetical protein FGIG_03873 [Fasciola gigantica]